MTADDIDEDDKFNNPDSIAQLENRNKILSRLEILYIKIWLGLRWAVTQSFRSTESVGDVLSAGSNVQVS